MARRVVRHVGTLFALIACAGLGAATAPPTFTPEQLRADLAALAAALRDMPPDLAHTTDPKKVTEALLALERQIGKIPLDRDAAWRLFATLNPLLADGHLFVGFLDWRAEARTHLASGGVFFPFEVKVTPGGEIFVEQALGGHVAQAAGTRLVKINDTEASVVTAALLARVHGDTPNFRAALLSRRFWLYYWNLPQLLDIIQEKGGPRRPPLTPSRREPA